MLPNPWLAPACCSSTNLKTRSREAFFNSVVYWSAPVNFIRKFGDDQITMATTSEEDAELRILEVVNARLAKTPKDRIAYHVPQITQLLTSCKTILSGDASSSKKGKSDNSVAIHKFKTNLSSLLNDRFVEARWAAVVLIKSTVETGGWEMLKDCKSWVNGLIAVLKKADPPTTKKNIIVTVTRIFMLSKDYPTLTRQVTTPSLPPFITACLNHFQDKNSGWAIQKSPFQRELLENVLEAFSLLIPRHPTIFRSFITQIRAITTLIISRNSSRTGDVGEPWTTLPSSQSVKMGQRVFVQLHLCAPKNGFAQEWNSTHELVIRTIHEVANEIFRAVLETWTTDTEMPRPTRSDATLPNDPGRSQSDALGNTAWLGLKAGADRMICLLGLLQQYIATPTSSSVTPRLGLICSLLTRLFLVTIPRADDETRFKGLKVYNDQVSTQERLELFVSLPKIHAAAIAIIMHVVLRFGTASMSMCPQFLDQLAWVFDAERGDMSLRETTYSTLIDILNIIGPSLSSGKIGQLETMVKRCSSDAIISKSIISSTERSTAATPKTNGNTSTVNPNTIMETPPVRSSAPTSFNSLQLAARALIATMLSKLPAENMPQTMRDQLDIAAASSGDANALTASALNPAPLQTSILPIMASIHPDSPQVEAILRPRMPVIHTGPISQGPTSQTNGITQKVSTPNAHVEDAEVLLSTNTGDCMDLLLIALESSANDTTSNPRKLQTRASLRRQRGKLKKLRYRSSIAALSAMQSQLTSAQQMAGESETPTSNVPSQDSAARPESFDIEQPTPIVTDDLSAAAPASDHPISKQVAPTREVDELIKSTVVSTVATPDGLTALEAAIDAASSPEQSLKPVDESVQPVMSEKKAGKQKVVEADDVEERDFGQPQEMDVDENDDDGDSDFEIPKLVFRKDVEDDEDENGV